MKESDDVSKDDVYNSSTPYDDVYRTQINELPKFLIPMVNEIFDENFSEQATVILSPNEHFHNLPKGGTDKKITDSSFAVEEILGQSVAFEDTGGKRGKFLVECESSPSNDRMLIRIFEYAIKTGLDQDSEAKDGELFINVPRSAVIFLRTNRNTRDVMRAVIHTEEGNLGLPVHVLKLTDYTLDDIFEKRLFMLLPFYIFNYEKQFKELDKDDQKRNELIATFNSIIERLDKMVPNEQDGESQSKDALIDTYAVKSIIEYTKQVTSNLTKKYPNVRKGVMSAMGGRILDYEAKRIKDAAWNEGRIEGWNDGRREGWNDGRDVGINEGKEQGEDKFARLLNILCSSNRNDDIQKVAVDKEYRKKLFAEFNII